MRKKYLSALLFGALLFASTGTFTSCKDYDDDINGLREQIDGQEGVSSKISAIESTVNNLQSAQSGLQSAIDAAESAAQQAALAAQNAAIEAAKTDLEAVKAELQAAATADKETLQAAIDAANESLAEISGQITALQQFKTNTETSLDALAQADITLQGAITNLEASVAANAQQIGANTAAIEAQVAALEEYKTLTGADIDALKASIEAIEAGQLTEEMANQIAEQVTEAVGAELDVISAAFSKAVTFVTVINPYLNGETNAIIGNYTRLDLRTTEARVDYTFGKDEAEASMYTIANQHEFKVDEKAFLSDSIVIRVSPTNAVLTPSQISFVNSELGTLDQLVTVESVEPVKGMVTSRGISANGLWKVKFKMNETNYTDLAYQTASLYGYKEGMEKKDVAELKSIQYAVAVKDQPEETDRYVTSDYSLTLGREYTPVYGLRFTVNDKNVNDIRNRFYRAESGEWIMDQAENLRYDYAWETEYNEELGYYDIVTENNEFVKEVDGIEDPNYTWTINGKEYAQYYDGDNRQWNSVLTVKPNEEFTVALDYNQETLAGIYGFYVTLDANRAVESAPSEINAWNSYVPNIEGLNQITTDSQIKLNIKDSNANGDIIGFRVYAINQDGTLVDPDGKAFYVSVGEIGETEITGLTFTPETNAGGLTTNTVDLPEEIADLLRQDGYYWTRWTLDENNPTVTTQNGQYVDYSGRFGINVLQGDNGLYESVQLVMFDAPYLYKDGGTYSGTFDIMNQNNVVVRTVKVSFKKEMPAFPSEFSMKDNQLTNGAKEVTVDINNWNRNEVHNLASAFNGISNTNGEIIDDNYEFTCDNDKIVFNANYGFDLNVSTVEEAAELIADKGTADKVYNVAVGYVYEDISSESEDNNYVAVNPEADFKLRLVCGDALTSTWKTTKVNNVNTPVRGKISYNPNGGEVRIPASDLLTFKKGDTEITLANDQIKDCHLVTGGVNDEYFTVEYDNGEFVFKSRLSQNPPVSDIEGATLTFTLVDAFGHENPETYSYIDITVD